VKVYVSGNCLSGTLANCLSVMLPDATVERLNGNVDPATFATDDDIIFRQRRPSVPWTLRPTAQNETLYPRFWFNAFHPDLVHVSGSPAEVPGPLGAYHSSLALYGWHRGLSVAETARLFCEPVFEQLSFFKYWEAAKRALFEEAAGFGPSFDAMFATWQRSGCFMHTVNHPVVRVIADLARALALRAGLTVTVDTPERYVPDSLLNMTVWPVYPEIGERLGLSGAYAFKPPHPPQWTTTMVLGLDAFLEASFKAYAIAAAGSLACARLETPAYRDLEQIASRRVTSRGNGARAVVQTPEPQTGAGSPYAALPPSRWWRQSIEQLPAADVDPVGTPPFSIGRSDRIATAGSCFAQHIARALEGSGYNYLVTEPAPPGLAPEAARSAGYGLFSTRCGNVYTARQLLQLFDRAHGAFDPGDRAWLRPDGRYADPFRPRIEPDGFATVDALIAARDRHLAAVRAMFERLDVFVFTLGLTEAWRAISDGAVFPVAPSVVAGTMESTRYEFVNFTVAEVSSDLRAFLARLAGVNSAARVILTVSPVPLVVTYEPRHVLVSATYSKSALRAAVDEIEREHPHVWYFPAYEIVASAFTRGAYYKSDFRSVNEAGVDQVMRLFLTHCRAEDDLPLEPDARLLDENRAGADVPCDEDALAGEASDWFEYRRSLELEKANDGFIRAEPPAGVLPMDALEPASMRASIEAELPGTLSACTVIALRCVVNNDGDAVLVTGGKHPIFLCYRWYDESEHEAEVGASIHTVLPSALAPGASVAVGMRICAPEHPGRYRLRVALLQSNVAWFDDIDAANGIDVFVDVIARNASAAPALRR
jgi:GSCFA family protein/polysaccharide biosynthesis acetyltransferase WcbI-like protein